MPVARQVGDHRRVGGQQLLQLAPDDGHGGDRFGYDVSLSGDRLLVGAPLRLEEIRKAWPETKGAGCDRE